MRILYRVLGSWCILQESRYLDVPKSRQ